VAREQMGFAARQFADRDRGATSRTVAALARFMAPPPVL